MISDAEPLLIHTLMDYGSLLKGGTGDPDGSLRKKGSRNPNLRSASYARQTPFEGSDRQVRGIILRELLVSGEIVEAGLGDRLSVEQERLERILRRLEKDGFIGRADGKIRCRENWKDSG